MSVGDPAGTWIELSSSTFFSSDSQSGLECQAPLLAVSEDKDYVMRCLVGRGPNGEFEWPLFTLAGTDDKVYVNPAQVITLRDRIDDWSNLV